MGRDAPGIYGRHEGSGNIEIGAENAYITTTGDGSRGIHGYLGYRPGSPVTPDTPPEAAGNYIHIVASLSTIETTGSSSSAIVAEHYGGDGWVRVRVRDSTITTRGSFSSSGIFALRHGTGTGDVRITVSDTRIQTEGSSSYGVYGRANAGAPRIVIDIERGHITTAGRSAHGVRGFLSLANY